MNTRSPIRKVTIRSLPACKDWKGNQYPARWGVTLHDRLGNRWDGGEYATLAEAKTKQEAVLFTREDAREAREAANAEAIRKDEMMSEFNRSKR